MKKVISIFLIMSFLLFCLAGCGNNSKNSSKNSIQVNKVSAEVSINNNISNSVNDIDNQINPTTFKEVELASFSTKLAGKDTPRSRNIGITTSTLNETVVGNGETFSFCNTVGEPTAEKGYEKADSFNEHGKTVKTLGGGNCQVSSTLYNVVLQISELEVVERHPHIKPVHYVEKDKDAAVSYGSVDFKFKNNMGMDIKIYANSDLNNINIRIVKLEPENERLKNLKAI